MPSNLSVLFNLTSRSSSCIMIARRDSREAVGSSMIITPTAAASSRKRFWLKFLRATCSTDNRISSLASSFSIALFKSRRRYAGESPAARLASKGDTQAHPEGSFSMHRVTLVRYFPWGSTISMLFCRPLTNSQERGHSSEASRLIRTKDEILSPSTRAAV